MTSTKRPQCKAILSNSLQELFSHLLNNINIDRIISFSSPHSAFSTSTDTTRPSRSLILVPSKEKKSWLLHQFAHAYSPTIDIDIVTPQELKSFFCDEGIFPCWRSMLIPIIVEALQTHYVFQDPLDSYYKALLLESMIAHRLFSTQQSKKEETMQDTDRQLCEVVWNRIVAQYSWFTWQGICQQIQYIRTKESKEHPYLEKYTSFYIFGVSSLSETILDLCQEIFLSPHMRSALYVISPCFHFWSDSKSDLEVKHAIEIVKRKNVPYAVLQRYEMLLHDRNELLANLGLMSREFAKEIEEREFETSSIYTLPNHAILKIHGYDEYIISDFVNSKEKMPLVEKNAPISLLQRIQTDILLYVPQKNKKQEIGTVDTSLRFTVVPSIFQEVEQFYTFLTCEAAVLSHDKKVEIGSIIVLVPELAKYKEAFLRYFHSQQPLQLQFWENNRVEKSRKKPSLVAESHSLTEWLHRLFNVVGRSFGATKTKQEGMLSCRYAMKSFVTHCITLQAIGIDFDAEDPNEYQKVLSSLLSFLEKTNTTWCLSSAHSERELDLCGLKSNYTDTQRHFDAIYTILLQQLMGIDNENLSYLTTDHELMKVYITLYELLEKLEKLWEFPLSRSVCKTIQEWVHALQMSVSYIMRQNDCIEEHEVESFELTCHSFKNLYDRCAEVKVPFEWFFDAFFREYSRFCIAQTPQMWQGHVIVAERKEFDCISCNGIALLGVSQDQFPEKSKEYFFSHLDMCFPQVGCDISSIDKSLFLDTLLRAKSWCYYSTCTLGAVDGKNALSSFSPLIRDVIRYIDVNYIFEENGVPPSQHIVKVIKAYIPSALLQNISTQSSDLFTPIHSLHITYSEDMFELKHDTSILEKSIFIDDLIGLAVSPYEWFYEKTFHIKPSLFYMAYNHSKKGGASSLFISSRLRLSYIKTLFDSDEKQQFNRKGLFRWPKGTIGELSTEIAHQMHQEMLHNLAYFGMSEKAAKESFQCLLFDHEYESISSSMISQEKDNVCQTHFEPLQIYDGLCRFFIQGNIRHSTKEHMIVFSENWQHELFARFPEYLVRTVLFHMYNVGSASCVIVSNRTLLTLTYDKIIFEKALQAWCYFVEEATKKPFPFTYNIVKKLIQTKEERDSESQSYIFKDIIDNELHIYESLSVVHPLYTVEYICQNIEEWFCWADSLYGIFFDQIVPHVKKEIVLSENE